MQRLPFLILGFVGLLLILICGSTRFQKGGRERPNIIIILADDAGYADFGFMGSKDILTPNLDDLAKDGAVLTDAHVSASVCSPSRAGLLTGRYQQRFGHECNLEPNQPRAFDSSEFTIAEFLKQAGYKTSIFGKWHLGEAPHQHPLENGFDYFWGFLAGGRSYFPTEQDDRIGDSRAILENHRPSKFEGYITDAIGDRATEYIKNRRSDASPFFMYLSFNAPHSPMHAKQDVISKFGSDHKRPVYAAMLWSLDEAVGKVVATLKREKLYDNTLIFFLSDNGGAHNNGSSVYPFKGWKGNQYEGGTRVPFFVTWKNKIPAGKKFNGLTSSLDIYSTVAAIAGAQYKLPKPLDGVDLIPYLSNNKSGNPHDQLMWRKDEMSTIRKGAYKLITSEDSLAVLYNVIDDYAEVKDLKKANPRLADSLRVLLNSWEAQLIKPLWKEPEDWNKVTRMIYRDLMKNKVPLVKEPKDLKNID